MDDKRVLDIFTRKLMHMDLHDSIIATHEEITLALINEALEQEDLTSFSSEDWQIIKNVVRTKSQALPFLSFAQEADNVVVEAKYFPELNSIFQQSEASINYIINNYDDLGHKSDLELDKLWSKEKIQLILNAILKEIKDYPNEVMETEYATVSSDVLKLTKKMLHLVLYAIIGKKCYDRFSKESISAMHTLAMYQHHFIEPDKKTVN